MVLTIHSNDGWQSLSFLQTEVLNIPSGTWLLHYRTLFKANRFLLKSAAEMKRARGGWHVG